MERSAREAESVKNARERSGRRGSSRKNAPIKRRRQTWREESGDEHENCKSRKRECVALSAKVLRMPVHAGGKTELREIRRRKRDVYLEASKQ